MAELKTKKNNASVSAFLNAVEPAAKRKDAKAIHKLMREVIGEKARMWGSSVVGYGTYRYKNASGKEVEWMLAGFSPRKQNLTLYIMYHFKDTGGLLKKLGKHKTGKACLYINKLEDVDLGILKKMVAQSVKAKKARN